MKQQKLVEKRNYRRNPRINGEPITEHRGDYFDDTPSMTKQSEAEACDINNIMKRYQATGLLPDLIERQPMYGDFSTVQTFHEAQGIVAQAREQFEALPAEMRDRFQNDPAKFLEFVENPKNEDELVKMGLATAKPQPEHKAPDKQPPAPDSTALPKPAAT